MSGVRRRPGLGDFLLNNVAVTVYNKLVIFCS